MDQFKQCFEKYGVDYDVAMGRLLNNRELYIQLLGMYCGDSMLDKLEECLKNKDFDGAFDVAHTIKGVTANMELKNIFKRVCEMVEPLRVKDAGADYDMMLDTIKKEYSKVEEFYKELQELS